MDRCLVGGILVSVDICSNSRGLWGAILREGDLRYDAENFRIPRSERTILGETI